MKKRAVIAVLATWIGAGLAHAATPLFTDAKAADNFKLYWLVKTATPPVIDGALGDAAWKNLEPLQDWGVCNYGRQDGAPGEIDLRACWDERNLYLGARLYHRRDPAKDMAEFKRNLGNLAAAIYARECLEIHIDGNLDHATRFQAIVNAGNERMMLWYYDFGWGILVNNDYGLDADWESAGGIGDDHWTLEVRVALRDIQVQPRAGYMFGINPCWFNWADTRENSPGKYGWQFLTWSTHGDSHHDPRLYGRFLLVEEKPQDLVSGLRLAYPDLDKRTVMIQTPDGFTTVRNGAVATQSYLEKLREDLDRARAARARLATLTGDDAQQKIVARMRSLWAAQEETLGKLETDLGAKAGVNLGDLRRYRADLAKVADALDNAYWQTKQEMFLQGLP